MKKNRIFQKGQTHGLKFRILSHLLIITLITFFVLFVSVLSVLLHILTFSLESRGKDDMQLLSYLINEVQEDAIQTSKALSINEEVHSLLLRQSASSVSNDIREVYSLMTAIERNVLLQDYVQSFCIVSPSHHGYLNSSPGSNNFLDWFEETALNGQTVSEFHGFTDNYVFPTTVYSSAPTQLFSYVCSINVAQENHQWTSGNLILNLNFDRLISKLTNQTTLFDQIAILNHNKELLYLSSGEATDFLEDFSSMKSSTEKVGNNYYISQHLPTIGWYLVTATNMSQAYHYLQPSYVMVGIGMMCSVIFVILIFLYPLLNQISLQIQNLSTAIDQVRMGNLDTTISLSGSRELNNISNGFNLMTVSLKEYLRKSIEETNRAQKLSFELLVARINPHFIYNTLNSIIYLARKKEYENIINMTSAFIYLLQDSIHLGHSSLFARFENEIEVIRQYIIIQQYRYKDRFQFHLNFDDHLKGCCYIPRNILQPLVENSLIHGICMDDKSGNITLSLKKSGEYVYITLEDNGVGMEQSYADQLLLSPADTTANYGSKIRPIGINNIADRLRYLFPDRHEFTIHSQPGNGTVITLLLPFVTNPDVFENGTSISKLDL